MILSCLYKLKVAFRPCKNIKACIDLIHEKRAPTNGDKVLWAFIGWAGLHAFLEEALQLRAVGERFREAGKFGTK